VNGNSDILRQRLQLLYNEFAAFGPGFLNDGASDLAYETPYSNWDYADLYQSTHGALPTEDRPRCPSNYM
jgi:hypothetical protein